MSKRRARLNEQLKRELSEMIRTQVRDPRVGLVTITGVEVAADLGSARVWVRVVGDDEELARTLEGLDAAAPFLRTALGKVLHLRRIPELRFREDRSLAGARRIEEVLSAVLPHDDEAEADGTDAERHGRVDAPGDGDGSPEGRSGGVTGEGPAVE